MKSTNVENMAMLGVAVSGAAWGLFWMPIRALDDAGVSGVWSIVLFQTLPALLLLPLFIARSRQIIQAGRSFHIAGILTGLALVLYATALVYTEVVRALLFFYMTPLWSTLLARVILKEAITWQRWVAIGLAISGLIVIMKIDSSLSIDLNVGDLMGLASGVIWAFAAVYMRSKSAGHGTNFTLSYFLWSSVIALALTTLPLEGAGTPPNWATIMAVLPWILPVVLVLAIPPAFLMMWGATILNPGLVSILFMTEISAGAITAALWAGESFGLHEGLGVILITLAGAIEPVLSLLRAKTQNGPQSQSQSETS